MAGTMTNKDRGEWTYFFQQLERFIIDLQRQRGIASERYTEYAIEKLALVHSSIQEIHDVMERALNRLTSEETFFWPTMQRLRQLKEAIVLLQSIWHEYQNSIGEHSAKYSVAVEHTQQKGRPRFSITREQLEYLHFLSFTWDTIASMLGVSRMTIYRRRQEY